MLWLKQSTALLTVFDLYSIITLYNKKVEQNIVTVVFNQLFQITRYQYMGTPTYTVAWLSFYGTVFLFSDEIAY